MPSPPYLHFRWSIQGGYPGRGRRSRFQPAQSKGAQPEDDLFHDNRAHSIEAVLVDHGHPDPTAPLLKESRALDSLPAEPVGHRERRCIQ